MIRSNLCNYSDAYIHVKGVTSRNYYRIQLWKLEIQQHKVQLQIIEKKTFKNFAPFINCISRINHIQVDDVNDIYVVTYNLRNYSENCSKILGNFIHMNQLQTANTL